MNLAEKSSIISTNNVTIAENEQRVYDKGFKDGKAEGGNTEEAYNNGVADGKQAEYDEFWDIYQGGGNRTHYAYAFYKGWNDINFKPKYDIIPQDFGFAFRESGIVDGLKNMANKGLAINTSNMLHCSYAFFNSSKLTEIPFDISLVSLEGSASYLFYGCGVHTIKKVIFPSRSVKADSNTFAYLNRLQNIRFEGEIWDNNLNFQWSPLTIESLRSLISCLKDYSTDTSGTVWKVTIGSTNYAKLTADDLLAISQKGWQFV